MEDFMHTIERAGYVPKEYAPYELHDPYGERLRTEAVAMGAAKLLVPVDFLQGTQTADGFSSHKGKRAERAIEEGGIDFLLQYPGIATAVFTNGNADIYVEDGHHRTVKANKLGINVIPFRVLTIEQMAEIRRRMGRKPDSPREVGLRLLAEASEARGSLEKRGVGRFGVSIPGVNNMDELTNRLSSF